MNKRLLTGVGAVALVVAVAACLWLGGSAGDGTADGAAARQKGRIPDAKSSSAAKAKEGKPRRIADAAKATRARRAADAGGGEAAGAETAELSAEDQKKLDAIQDALDAENFDKVKELAESLVSHPAAEVRQRAVEALEWFGEKSLASLTPFLADSDEDVKSAAMTAVEQTLSEMESESAKLAYIESLFQINGACDENGLTMLAGQLNGLADSAAVVDAAVRVISANRNPDAVKEMREVYEFVTGEPYTTADAAQKWRAENAEAAEPVQ